MRTKIESRKQALANAAADVSAVYKFGDGWRYSSFDTYVKAWRESPVTNHATAVWRRSKAIAVRFADAVGCDGETKEFRWMSDPTKFPTLRSMLADCRPC